MKNLNVENEHTVDILTVLLIAKPVRRIIKHLDVFMISGTAWNGF
jgi:hypothetical protein